MARFFNSKALQTGTDPKTGDALAQPPSPKTRNLVARAPGKLGTISSLAVRTRARSTSADGSPAAAQSSDQNSPRDLISPESVPGLTSRAFGETSTGTDSRPFMVTVGNIALFLYLISGELNDLSHHFIGTNAYVSWISEGLIAVALLSSGTGLRAWRSWVGKLWVLLLILMICSIPGSEWPGQSFRSAVNYSLRSTLVFFAVCAFVTDARTMKTAILGEVTSGVLLLIGCLTMGGTAPGGDRFLLEGSYFYGGANDLAIGLTVASGFFLYWMVQKNLFKVLVGGSALLASIYFLMKTGSRGGFLAMAILVLVSIIFSASYRWRLVPIVLLAPAMFFLVPSDLVHRLSYVFLDTSSARASTAADTASLASQEERTYMFWRSVDLMWSHPIFGVGMDCFIDTIFREDTERHEHTAALGTHNSYTQIGCECGIPALLVYLSILWISLRRTYRVFRESGGVPGLEIFPAASLCLFSSVIGVSAALFFYHAAYSPIIPILTGLMAGISQAFSHERPAALEHAAV